MSVDLCADLSAFPCLPLRSAQSFSSPLSVSPPSGDVHLQSRSVRSPSGLETSFTSSTPLTHPATSSLRSDVESGAGEGRSPGEPDRKNRPCETGQCRSARVTGTNCLCLSIIISICLMLLRLVCRYFGSVDYESMT